LLADVCHVDDFGKESKDNEAKSGCGREEVCCDGCAVEEGACLNDAVNNVMRASVLRDRSTLLTS